LAALPEPGTESRVTVMLADNNPLVLSALSEIFDRDVRFSLVATSSTAEGFMSSAMLVPVRVGIISWALPELGGGKVIELLRAAPNAPRIVVYGDESIDLARKAMSAGAAGFAARSGSVNALLETCLAVARGQMAFPFLDVRALQEDPIGQLSKRERALLEFLARGLTNRELAREFGVSENTVKFHLSNIFEKLDVKNRAQAISFYYEKRSN